VIALTTCDPPTIHPRIRLETPTDPTCAKIPTHFANNYHNDLYHTPWIDL
jgi:hypothetical protein